METGGPSGAPNNSQERRELRYMHASHANISNFVSVKLSGQSNYRLWKAQMLCFVRSQCLEDILQQASPNNHFNELVKGWIFGSVNEDILWRVIEYEYARVVWGKLEELYSHNLKLFPENSQEMGDSKYMHASNVNVSNFVSVKLSGGSNYRIWKTQMLCLLRSQGLEYILQDAFFESYHFDRLVKGWIFGSVNEDILLHVIECEFASTVWKRLEALHGHNNEGGTSRRLTPHGILADLRSMHKSNPTVNIYVWNLTGKVNYSMWKMQMLWLVRSQGLDYILQDALCRSNRFDELVKGWILDSVEKDVLKQVIQYKYASEVWRRLEELFGDDYDEEEKIVSSTPKEKDELKSIFDKYPSEVWRRLKDLDVHDDEDVKINEKIRGEVESINSDKIRKDLKNAVVEGCWWKAKAILKNNKDAVREELNEYGDTILHLAVALGQDKFLEKLLNFTDGELIISKENSRGQTAFHVAVIFDNYYAFQLLFKDDNFLDIIVDDHCTHGQAFLRHLNLDMILFLIKNSKEFEEAEYDKELHQYIVPFLEKAIFTKRYDVARELVNAHPESVRLDDHVMMTVATTFPSELGIGEAFLYPSLKNKGRKIVKRSKLLFDSFRFFYTMAEDVLWGMRSYTNDIYIWWLREIVRILLVPIALIYPIYQLICLIVLVLSFPCSVFYFLLWKVLAIVALPIKNIEKKKKEYKEAIELLNTISEHISKMCTYPVGHPGYSRPLLEAARQGAFEVVDEILFRTPGFIKSVTKEKHNIIHLAIINRSEKIYNLIYHMLYPMGLYRDFKDSSGNNLSHMAGRLAPPRVLACTTGAVLQLQRELQWYEEVKKLMLPRDLMEENNNEETPKMVFAREHADLVKEGEQWMKATAESCSITAALIVTIVFAAAITVPGGSNQETGIPLFRKEIAFTIFALSDAVSLFASATSLLVFLSILTTRFSGADFLVSLPRRLIIGLCALFLSTTSMMVAFGAILFLVFCDQRPWMLAPIGVLACFPIATIVTLQFPLLVDLFRSTYIPVFGKQSYIERGKFIPTNYMIEIS